MKTICYCRVVFMEKSPKINIIFEDNHLLVVEKPINIPVQEDSSKDIDLLTILKDYLKEKYNKPGNVYLGLVHRLDRPVGGVMVFAKTSKCASRLSDQIRKNEIDKIYYAVCEGDLKNSDTLEDYLLKDQKENITTINKNGKFASLDYEVIKRKNNLNLVKINLHTGRSHQIRVQFSSRGNPLVGDQKYNKKATPNTSIALFAKSLSFNHPISKERLNFEIDLPNRYPFNLF